MACRDLAADDFARGYVGIALAMLDRITIKDAFGKRRRRFVEIREALSRHIAGGRMHDAPRELRLRIDDLGDGATR